MELPKKLADHHLVETIVDIRFVEAPDIAPALIPGLLMPGMRKMGYIYASLSSGKMSEKEPGVVKMELDASEKEPETGLFFNADTCLKVLINCDNISFNYLSGRYGGWVEYSRAIHSILEILQDSSVATGFERVMMRYISEYPELDVMRNIKPQITLPADSEFKPQELKFKREQGHARAYISVSSMMPRYSSEGKEAKRSSLYDVTVYQWLEAGDNSLEAVKKALEEVHFLELESFFGMLKPEFIETLKPEY